MTLVNTNVLWPGYECIETIFKKRNYWSRYIAGKTGTPKRKIAVTNAKASRMRSPELLDVNMKRQIHTPALNTVIWLLKRCIYKQQRKDHEEVVGHACLRSIWQDEAWAWWMWGQPRLCSFWDVVSKTKQTIKIRIMRDG